MSFDALAWAARQQTGSSGTKLVLLGLAECADRQHGLAFPSIAALVEFSSLDRKSIVSNLDKLEASGFITDTGRKVGLTKQIKVYQLNIQTAPKTEQSQKRNSPAIPAKGPENGTRNQSEPVKTGAEAPYKQIGALWNSLSPASGIPEIRVWNHSRKQMCNARVKEHGLEAILEGVRKIHRSPFCRGKMGDGRKQDIMLLLQPKTCPRVLEGFYGEDEPKRALTPEQQRAAHLRDAAFYDKIDRPDDATRCRQLAAHITERLEEHEAAPLGSIAQKIVEGARLQ